MGCVSSSNSANKPTGVATQRRRLSVGQVDKVNEAEDTSTNEDDRGLIQQLSQEAILNMAAAGEGRKMSIGSGQDAGKTSFANKAIEQQGDEGEGQYTGMGFTCRKGLKPEAPNQDSWIILKIEDYSIYGVFDGHGQKGHDCSNFVKDAMPKLIFKDERFKSPDMTQMLVDTFKKTQSLVRTADRMKKLSAQMSGTTATLCIHDHTVNDKQPFGKLWLAHAADSTAVLGKVSENKEIKGIALTRDHKPDLKDERARIEKAGAFVEFDGYAKHRVYAKNDMRYPGLTMSRCLGNLKGHDDCGITCEPEVKDFVLQKEDTIFLLCSDGVWEFITPTEAVQSVSTKKPAEAQKAADQLAKEAWDRWIREEGGAVVDDITVVLLYLHAINKGTKD